MQQFNVPYSLVPRPRPDFISQPRLGVAWGRGYVPYIGPKCSPNSTLNCIQATESVQQCLTCLVRTTVYSAHTTESCV